MQVICLITNIKTTDMVDVKEIGKPSKMYTKEEEADRIAYHNDLLLTELNWWMDNHFGNWFNFRDHLLDDTDSCYVLPSYYVVRLFKNLANTPSSRENQAFIINELKNFAYQALKGEMAHIDRHFIDTIREIQKLSQLESYRLDIETLWENFAELVQLAYKFDIQRVNIGLMLIDYDCRPNEYIEDVFAKKYAQNADMDDINEAISEHLMRGITRTLNEN